MLRLLHRRRYNEWPLKWPWKESWRKDGDGGRDGDGLAYIWLLGVVAVGLDSKGLINCCPLSVERCTLKDAFPFVYVLLDDGNNHRFVQCNMISLCAVQD